MQITQENLAQLEQWIARLDAASKQGTGSLPFDASESDRARFAQGFTDEYGNRARTTTPLLAHMLDVQLANQARPQSDLDERLWWSICSNEDFDSNTLGPGPSLTNQSDDMAIEHWTQVELCALHALWTLNLQNPSAETRKKITHAGIWMMNEFQPDNAINRPWGIGVFIYLSLSLESSIERSTASMYAQTLLHNCSITLGKPDILSACILLDAARSLKKIW